jgi:putative transposase
MPDDDRERLEDERQMNEKQAAPVSETADLRRSRIAKQQFAAEDRHLDRTADGPLHLNDPAAAKIVEDAILFGTPERYALLAWCVMANHVHVLLTPCWDLSKITQGIKGFAANRINTLHGKIGRQFWQRESYDHWSRDPEETGRIIQYIENNPVAAELCEKPADWPWSSARFRSEWVSGQPYPHAGEGPRAA